MKSETERGWVIEERGRRGEGRRGKGGIRVGRESIRGGKEVGKILERGKALEEGGKV